MLDSLISLFVELEEEEVMIAIQRLIKAKIGKKDIIKALNTSLEIIGNKYENGDYTLSDLMMAGILYQQVMAMDCIDLSKDITTTNNNDTILIGTIESDMHDIGKSLFKSVASTSGFNLIDLGVNVKAEVFCDKIKKHKPDIVGISIVLTGAIPYLISAIKMIENEGLRDNVKIIIGGGIVDKKLCSLVGADGYTDDAVKGIEICQSWMNNNE